MRRKLFLNKRTPAVVKNTTFSNKTTKKTIDTEFYYTLELLNNSFFINLLITFFMKSVKVPNLSKVEANVPFVHFHKHEADSTKYFLAEILINAPLGSSISKPVINEDAATKTITVTFNLDHPTPEKDEAFELIHIDQFKVKNIYESEDTILSIVVHVNQAASKVMLMSASGSEANGSATVRYGDVKI